MNKDYVNQVLMSRSDLIKTREELEGLRKQINGIEAEYEEKMKPIKDEKNQKLRPLNAEYERLDKLRLATRNDMARTLRIIEENDYFNADIWKYIVSLVSFVEGIDMFCFRCDINMSICYYDRVFGEEKNSIKILELPAAFDLYYGDEELKCSYDFGDYEYVKNYLDAIINYRIAAGAPKVAEEGLDKIALTVMKQFISENLAFIKERHDRRVREKQGEMNAIDEMLAKGDYGARRKYRFLNIKG